MTRPTLLTLLGLALSAGSLSAQIDFSDFHTPAQIDTEMSNLVNRFPGLAMLVEVGRSVENRPIRAIKISDNVATDEPDEGDLIFVAEHHAREWISTEMALYLAERILEDRGSDPALASDMNNLEIWIVPVVNPDGLAYTHDPAGYRYWRKNRSNNGDGTFGVDLNRNWGYAWGLNSGSSPNTMDDNYRGPSAWSEPEVRAIRDLALNVDNLKALVTYHSYSKLILAPWSYTTADAPGEPIHLSHQNRAIARIAAIHGQTYAPTIGYTASGETTDYLWGETRTVALTTELRPGPGLGLAGFSPSPTEILPSNEENFPMARALIHDAGDREVWIRDYPGDTGDEPSAVWTGSGWSQAFWVSPDITTVPATLDQGATVDLNVQVHNNSGSPLTNVEVRAYFTDPRISLEFPSPDATLIGTQNVTVPPGGTTVTFQWTVPIGTNSWGERHWCVGAVLLHEDDLPLTTEAQRTSNIAIRNFNTTEVVVGSNLLVAATNYLDVAAELIVRLDDRQVPPGWRIFMPARAEDPRGRMIREQRQDIRLSSLQRKARLLGTEGLLLAPGETILLPIRVEPPDSITDDEVFDIDVHAALLPLVAGPRVPEGNGFTYRIQPRSR